MKEELAQYSSIKMPTLPQCAHCFHQEQYKKCYVIRVGLLTSFLLDLGMENVVRFLTSYYSVMIWNLVRHELQRWGFRYTLYLLDLLSPTHIIENLLSAAAEKLKAAYNHVTVKALKRNITHYFRRLTGQGDPPQDFMV